MVQTEKNRAGRHSEFYISYQCARKLWRAHSERAVLGDLW
jgi:hypothetical protein